MPKQTLKARELVPAGKLDVDSLQQTFLAAIALEDEKAKLLKRTGRQYYAKAAIRTLGIELGLFELVDVASSVSAAPEQLPITDREKAQRIVERNAKRGWRTAPAIVAVAQGKAESFAEAATVVPKPEPVKPVKRGTTKRAKRPSANALTTTRAE
jgi:hypothetical protein